jgi:uncharacterized membrane protein
VLALIALLVAMTVQSTPPTTGLRVCNKTHATVTVALAIACYYTISGCRPWSSGWWSIDPGRCKMLLDYLKGMDDTEYLYYAYDARGRTWSGDEKFCVARQRQFEFREDRALHGCDAAAQRGFKHIPIPTPPGNPAEAPLYTLNITATAR